MREQNTKLHMSALLPLVVFALFAVCVLSVLLTGANVYQRLAQRDQDSYQRRTGAQYLATRVRQARGPVTVTDLQGTPALAFSQEEGGEVYTTWVYCHDGWLMELYAQPDSGLGPEDGAQILPAEQLELSREGSLLRAALCYDRGERADLALYLPLSGEGRP